MDEQTVRPYAEAHGKAIVDGDTAHAVADFEPSLRPHIAAVAATLPQPTTGAEIVSIAPSGDEAVIHIRYSGADKETTIRSVWKQVGERPLIVEAAPAT
jgi:hypothetical protein